MARISPHPDDCRDDLRDLARRRDAWLREQQAITIDLGDAALRARSAGISLTEVADLASVTRQTVYTAMQIRSDG